MNGAMQQWKMTPFVCPTCRLHLNLSPGEVARGIVPFHFDGRGGGEHCPAVDSPLALPEASS